MRRYLVVLTLLLLFPAAGHTAAVLTLAEALMEAERANPALGSAKARAEAMAAMPSQAGALPDPKLTLGALNVPVDTYKFDQEPMTQVLIGLSQELPSFGKRDLRRDTAQHEAAASGHEAEETRLRIRRDVTQAWWQLVYLDRALETVERNRMLLRQLVGVAESKYKVGRGLQQDVLLAQLELSKMLNMEFMFRSQRRQTQSKLNALLNRPVSAPLAVPASVPQELPVQREESDLLKRALELRPLLQARNNQLEASRARLQLADKDYTPNFTIGAAYGFREGNNPDGSERPDFVSVQLSMNLPLYAGAKQSMGVNQRAAEVNEKDMALLDSRAQVQADISRALADYERARMQVELFKTGIIPQSSQTAASMLAAYQVNKVDFLNLVRSQLTVYNYELQYWQALSEAHQALASLAAAVGEEVVHD